MALPRLIVNRRAPLDDRSEHGRIEELARLGGAPDLFGEAQGSPPIAIRHPHQTEAGVGIERQSPRLAGFRPDEEFLERRRVERMEAHDPCAR